MMETRLIPKKFLKLIKNLADENRNYKKIFGNVFWLEVVKEKNYSWFNLRLNSNTAEVCLFFYHKHAIQQRDCFCSQHGFTVLFVFGKF